MTANEAFLNYMSALPPRERIAKSRDLRKLGHLENYHLTNWRRGRARINVAWQRKISEIVGADVFKDVDK